MGRWGENFKFIILTLNFQETRAENLEKRAFLNECLFDS